MREEDNRLTTGGGRYTNDIALDNQAHMAIVRAPVASARILSIDCAEALALPGVLAVFTGKDAKAAGFGIIEPAPRHKRPDGETMFITRYGVLADERVRFVGDVVAVVVAETAEQAEDAREAVLVDYEELPAVTDIAKAFADGAPLVWDEVPGNIGFRFEAGDAAATQAGIDAADHVVELTFRISRLTACAMEPRAAIGEYDPAANKYTLTLGTQTTHTVREYTAKQLGGIDKEKIRVVTHDVGGSFGMKNAPMPEYPLVLWMARQLGRPVRWLASRNESFLGDPHARDNLTTARLGLDRNGRFLALQVETLANQGAYFNRMTPQASTGNIGGLAGVYRTPAVHALVYGMHTHTQPTTPYRGAGRPEATFAIERLIDIAASELGIDRADIRRRNLIQPDQMPFKTGLTYTYDSGDFPAILEETLQAANWDGFEARRKASEARGLLRGIGLVNPIEIAGGPFGKPFAEFAEIRFDKSGNAKLLMGGQDCGQGFSTTFRRMTKQMLGLADDRLSVVTGDTDQVKDGVGTFGSRTMCTGGTALYRAAEEVKRKALELASEELEASIEDIVFDNGTFRVTGTDAAIHLHDLAARAPDRLTSEVKEAPENATFPNGCHICEVEIDPETGQTDLVSYVVTDDVGTVVNPMLVKGQIHGGVAQGYGQAVGEAIVYDADSGQLVTGSFMDYRMPRSNDLPSIEVISHPVPTATNPLGVKGAGEAGTVGALPCVINAIVDALKPCGIRHIEMPATPEKIWQAIRDATAGGNAR
ncbi:xanthine dehydrogenase family protein molybdopterin-binding subunit [Breoghania sp. L-A4]|nr:xanthine dehydrogenase family protein molybdopterin-binding subunit [Breoghania sp. L-A4]